MARTCCCIATDAALKFFQTTWAARRFVIFCSKYFTSFSAVPFWVWSSLRSSLHQCLHLTYKWSPQHVLSTRRIVPRFQNLSALSWSSEALQPCIYFPFKRGPLPIAFWRNLICGAKSSRKSKNAQFQVTRKFSWYSHCKACAQSTCCYKVEDFCQSYLSDILGNSTFKVNLFLWN